MHCSRRIYLVQKEEIPRISDQLLTGAFGVRAFTRAVDFECAFQARKADFAIESCVKGDPVNLAVPCALAQTIQSLYDNSQAHAGYT